MILEHVGNPSVLHREIAQHMNSFWAEAKEGDRLIVTLDEDGEGASIEVSQEPPIVSPKVLPIAWVFMGTISGYPTGDIVAWVHDKAKKPVEFKTTYRVYRGKGTKREA